MNTSLSVRHYRLQDRGDRDKARDDSFKHASSSLNKS